MRALRQASLAVGLLLGTTTLASAADEMKAEVIHWWTSGGESAAIKVFADEFNADGGVWVDNAIAGGSNARTAGINRIVGGNPPTAMQFNTGKQLDELVANGFLTDIDAVAAEGKWADVLPKAIIDASTRDGKWVAVPVNIHGQNWLFYNTKVLADAGVEPPKSWADVAAAGEKLKAAGVVPLAQGGQPWQEHLLFDALLDGAGGTPLFLKVYGGDVAAVESPEFRKVADLYGQLRTLVDPGSPGRNWNDATNMVITGKAAMQVMGDWAKGEFIAAGQTPDKEYGCTILGTDAGYIMGGDVFVFPKVTDPGQQKAQVVLASLMLSPEAQLAFNKKKGSVPVRLDVDVSSMDACAQKGVAMLKDPAKQVPSVNFLISPDLNGALDDVITQYWNTPSMTSDTFIQKFVGAMKDAG